jgi:putative ABC transport system permease protein
MPTNLKLALRVLARRKVFTAISLVGISLTLVVLVVATAILDNLFAPRQPQSCLDRMLVCIKVRMAGPNVTNSSNPGRAFVDANLRNLPGVEGMTVTSELEPAVVYHGGSRLEVRIRKADAQYWQILDYRFLEGGPFAAADVQANRSVAVITDRVRDQVFGRVPVAGRTIDIGGHLYRIAGVVPAVSVSQIWAYADVWIPLPLPTAEESTATFGRLETIVLAKDRGSIALIKREFEARVARYPIADPKQYTEIRSYLDTNFEAFARELTSDKLGPRAPMAVRGAAVAIALLFMTLPALNLITLNLSRILERSSEIGVRKAFGAPRRTLVGQFVFENIVLTLLGGAIAFVFALFVLHGIDRADLLPGAHFELNVRVFAYAMIIAAFFGFLSGVYPAWRMSRLDPVNALRGGAL